MSNQTRQFLRIALDWEGDDKKRLLKTYDDKGRNTKGEYSVDILRAGFLLSEIHPLLVPLIMEEATEGLSPERLMELVATVCKIRHDSHSVAKEVEKVQEEPEMHNYSDGDNSLTEDDDAVYTELMPPSFTQQKF